LVSIVLVLSFTTKITAADLSSTEVRASIKRGVDFLISKQRVDGSWSGHPGQPGGLTALCTLALLNAGEGPASPAVSKALKYLRGIESDAVYAVAMQTMVFCAADPARDRLLIRRNAQWLVNSQELTGVGGGGWGYGKRGGRVDNSNSQFAMLALHEAERIGVEIDKQVWERCLKYWQSTQHANGSWSYVPGEVDQPTGSMTCAGAASLIIATGKIHRGAARVQGDDIICCGAISEDDHLARALTWLGNKFTVERNPGRPEFLLYYLYGIERVGRLSSKRYLGKHDWYREGTAQLLRLQNSLSGFWRGRGVIESNPLVATSFAVLFLSKGLRPTVFAKAKYTGEELGSQSWDHHPEGLHRMTQRLEKRWKRDLTWQTVDIRSASVNQLLQAPIIMFSGRESLVLTDEQVQNMRTYVDQGGFILAEAACEGAGFDRDFRKLMERMFPESRLRLLGPDHPIWFAEQQVDPDHIKHVYGIDACCRTSVVYVPSDLSCLWQLARDDRPTDYSPAAKAKIENALRLGTNIAAYATNRELKDKLDRPHVTLSRKAEELRRGTLYVPKINHAGGADDAPNALGNLLQVLRKEVQLRVEQESELASVADSALLDHPISFMHGRRSFRFSPRQRRSLKKYLESGGLLFADSICASDEFSSSFRSEISAIFPEATLTRIPVGHPMFTSKFKGFNLASVTLRDPRSRKTEGPLTAQLTKTTPLLEGLEIDGRLAVIFSPYDLSCALENTASLQCKSYARGDAAKIGVNVILFALQQ